jgi:ankyrin repeat protein
MNVRVYHRRAWEARGPADLALRGDTEGVKAFLRNGQLSVYDLYGDKSYPVLWLAYAFGNNSNNYEVAKILLQAGADPFQKSEFTQGCTIVSAAFERVLANPESSQGLANIFPLQDYIEESDFTPLHLAVLGVTHVDISKMLQDPLHLARIDAKAGDGFTALHLAALRGDEHATRLLVRAGAGLEVRTISKGIAPLYYASRFNHFQVAQALIKAGANVQAGDHDGVQPIHGASIFNNGDSSKVFGLLLKHGANIHVRAQEGGTPLQYALSRGTIDAVRFLLQNGADPDSRHITGTPALFQAVDASRHTIVDLLLENGADIGVVHRGASVLHELAVYGDAEMMRTFTGRIFRGISTSLKDNDGKTPLNLLNERNPCADIREAFDCLLDSVEEVSNGVSGDISDDEFFDAAADGTDLR